MADLVFREIEVRFSNGTVGMARAEGNNAAWLCACGDDPAPLLARCFPPPPAQPRTAVFPRCGRRYAIKCSNGKPTAVVEAATTSRAAIESYIIGVCPNLPV
jgi:hypothetical protein